MRLIPTLLCLGLLVSAAGTADAKPKKKPSAKATAAASRPKGKASHVARRSPRAARWLGSSPITPLLVVKKNGLEEAGKRYCAPWSRVGGEWRAVGPWGQIVGSARVTGADLYDVTGCEELTMKVTEGSGGVGLWVSADADYTPPKSAQWIPSDAERAALAKTVRSLESVLVVGAKYGCKPEPKAPLEKRSLFFTMKKTWDDGEGTHTRWAVVGGPLFIIARLDEGGRWVGRTVEARAANVCRADAYHPRAVFDVDGDGLPEIFEHQNLGDAYGDVVWGYDSSGLEGRWIERAFGVHSSTA